MSMACPCYGEELPFIQAAHLACPFFASMIDPGSPAVGRVPAAVGIGWGVVLRAVGTQAFLVGLRTGLFRRNWSVRASMGPGWPSWNSRWPSTTSYRGRSRLTGSSCGPWWDL